MKINTDTIRDGIEIYLNKSIDKITGEELKNGKISTKN